MKFLLTAEMAYDEHTHAPDRRVSGYLHVDGDPVITDPVAIERNRHTLSSPFNTGHTIVVLGRKDGEYIHVNPRYARTIKIVEEA